VDKTGETRNIYRILEGNPLGNAHLRDHEGNERAIKGDSKHL
jgi:hypothetical protein